MSYFTMVCAWCNSQFTTGVVGGQMVGSGHACKRRICCAVAGCRKNSVVQVQVKPGVQQLRCADHIEGLSCGQWQVTGV